MTTELHAHPILDTEPNTPTQGTDPGSSIPRSRWPSHLQPSSTDETSSDTGDTTPDAIVDPLDESHPALDESHPPPATPHRLRRATLEEASTPRPMLVKARTTGEYIQHLHDRSRRQFLVDEGGPLPRRFSFVDDYGLDELRAPPILPDRERRKSLEHAWSHKPELPRGSWRERVRDDFVVASWIAFSAIWGALARIGLTSLSTYPGTPVFPLIWSQFVGCAVMGFLLQDKTLFPKEDRYVPLYIGLTTGFCGSLTSFSSFMWNCFQGLANLDPYYERGRGKNVLALASQVIITLSVSIASLRFGAHVAQVVRTFLPSVRELGRVARYLDWVGVVLGVLGWSGAAIMTGLIPEWRPELFAAVLGPAGAITRWQLSRFNPTIPSFPLGTFLANILATLLYAITIIIQARPGVSIPLLPCALLYGLDAGFCGCLSTISTFAVELDTLIRRHAYVYASVSIAVGILGMVLVVGIPAWTRGFESVCGL